MAFDSLSARRRRDLMDIPHDIELTQADGSPPTPWMPWTPSPVSTPYTVYAPVQEEQNHESDTEPLRPQQHYLHHWESEKPHICKTLLIQAFALLWLVPIVALLILNIKRHVIGASAWCPDGKCFPGSWAQGTHDAQLKAVRILAQYDRQSHNLVGALQFVAKALEVWFIVIATWLVYLLTTQLAARSAGLPIGYFTTPSEFDKIPSLFDPLMWSTLRRLPASRQTSRRARKRIWAFVAFNAFLCIVCNLMGPAVAVLVIPTLQWINTKKYITERLAIVNSGVPPSSSGFAWMDMSSTCDATEFLAQQYSCASAWGASLDSWAESYGAAQWSSVVISTEDMVTFTYNASRLEVEQGSSLTQSSIPFEYVIWSPSRQVLSSLTLDLAYIAILSSDFNETELAETSSMSADELKTTLDTYKEYNNTVQTIIQHNGPILGASPNVWLDFDNRGLWTTEVDSGRSIRCYEGYKISNMPMCTLGCGSENFTPVSGIYIKCLPIGAGWQDDYKTTNFTIDRQWLVDSMYWPEIQVTVHSSGKAGFLTGGASDADFARECLPKNGTAPASCDWDLLWETATNPDVAHRSKSLNTIEFFWDTTALSHTDTSNVTVAVDFVAFQAFANYSLDPSILTNSLLTADWELDLPKDATLDNATALALDPAWILATWTTNAGGNVSANTSIASEWLDGLRTILDLYDNGTPASEMVWTKADLFNKVALMPIIQTLSLIDYNTTAANSTDPNDDPQHPLLHRYARINVYAYGLASRTSWVGVVVTSIGCVIVLAEVALGLWDRRRFHSLTQLLVAALEHTYNDEFPRHMHHDEKNIARVPFRLENVQYGAGKFKFEKTV